MTVTVLMVMTAPTKQKNLAYSRMIRWNSPPFQAENAVKKKRALQIYVYRQNVHLFIFVVCE